MLPCRMRRRKWNELSRHKLLIHGATFKVSRSGRFLILILILVRPSSDLEDLLYSRWVTIWNLAGVGSILARNCSDQPKENGNICSLYSFGIGESANRRIGEPASPMNVSANKLLYCIDITWPIRPIGAPIRILVLSTGCQKTRKSSSKTVTLSFVLANECGCSVLCCAVLCCLPRWKTKAMPPYSDSHTSVRDWSKSLTSLVLSDDPRTTFLWRWIENQRHFLRYFQQLHTVDYWCCVTAKLGAASHWY